MAHYNNGYRFALTLLTLLLAGCQGVQAQKDSFSFRKISIHDLDTSFLNSEIQVTMMHIEHKPDTAYGWVEYYGMEISGKDTVIVRKIDQAIWIRSLYPENSIIIRDGRTLDETHVISWINLLDIQYIKRRK